MSATAKQACQILDSCLGLADDTARCHADMLRGSGRLPSTQGRPEIISSRHVALLLTSLLLGSATRVSAYATMRDADGKRFIDVLAEFIDRPHDFFELRLDTFAPGASLTYRAADRGMAVSTFTTDDRHARPAFDRFAVLGADTMTRLATAIASAPPVRVGRRRAVDRYRRLEYSMFNDKSKTKPAPRPVPLSFSLRDDPVYAEWTDKDIRLADHETRLDREESDILGKLSSRPVAPEMSSNVAGLLGDEFSEDDPLAGGLKARLRAVQAERRDVKAARSIAKQRQATARVAASRAICDRLKTEYVARVATLADALIAAHQANAALFEMTNALDTAGVVWTGSLPPAPARMLGAANDRTNKVAAWLRDAANDGLIDRKSIPQELVA